jgi:hypothetical protein
METQSSQVATKSRSDTTLRAVLSGLVPLGLLAAVVVVTLLVTAIARLLAAPQGFFVQQQIDVIVLVAGLAIAVAVYVVAIVRVLRQIGRWQRDGAARQASAARVSLALTALIVLLPVLLAVLLPQHPAP